MISGYIITISRVDQSKVEADTRYLVSDAELKNVNKEIGHKIVQGKVERALSDLDFDHLYLENN